MTDNYCDLEKAAALFKEFCQTVAALRHPETGCPWDLKQSHESLRKYLIEEAYETVDAINNGQVGEIAEELGDVLLQVVLHAQLGFDQKDFSIIEVVEAINSKMQRRHPHVFNGVEGMVTDAQLHQQWQAIKNAEKPKASSAGAFDKIKPGPALMQAQEIGKQAEKVRFDWQQPSEVFAVVRSELDELEEALQNSSFESDDHVHEELGDVFFSLVQLSRHLKINAELCAVDGNKKFLGRFKKLEAIASKQGVVISEASQEKLEELWKAVKSEEKP